jgi:hypothetical protein
MSFHATNALSLVPAVYSQIETMTQEPTHQRRKSLSQSSDRSPSRNGSSVELAKVSGRRPSISSMKGRLSSDSKRARAGSPALRRASMEKARAFAELVAGPALGRSSSDRSENDRPVQNGETTSRHVDGRADSGLSEGTKEVWRAFHDAVGSDRSSDPEVSITIAKGPGLEPGPGRIHQSHVCVDPFSL